MHKKKLLKTDKIKQGENDCNLAPNGGSCKAYFQMYFYNKSSGNCEVFIYGGCGGNSNNFSTKEECKKNCIDTVASRSEISCIKNSASKSDRENNTSTLKSNQMKNNGSSLIKNFCLIEILLSFLFSEFLKRLLSFLI